MSAIEASALRDLVDDYRTCELATLSRGGLPMAWPTAPLVDPTTGTITITTSIGLPQKAFNVRRDPRVALLFSDPTGSGRTDLPQVLVRGTAVCPEEIHTSPRGLEEYWARLYSRQPSSKANSANPVSRWLMDWYYMRLVITVTPTSVETLPPLVEPRVPTRPGPRRGGSGDAYALLARRLPQFGSAVLATPDGDEPPELRRVALVPGGERFRLEGLGGELPGAGPASVLLHGHDEQLWNLRLAASVGRVEATGQDLWFVPERFVPGPGDGGGPLAMVRTLRHLRGTAQRYLDKRGLPRPAVAWPEFAALT